ncbi:hypothetical protein AVEN_223038-1 [Araneus ventricosus]|uniref:Uncharacterized protein n=1 Tax=Araneus ventricosus TaxID=182803 RepID=A0A4Y2H8C9_ARAVE|nr:hypothetical protein AVEN_223038-1 [Araneus ventricosus]
MGILAIRDYSVKEGFSLLCVSTESEMRKRIGGLFNLISGPTRRGRKLALRFSPLRTEHEGRRHVCCVVFDADLQNRQFEIFAAADSTG